MEETKLNVWNIEEQLLQSRIIKIDGEINTAMAQRVTSYLDVLAKLADYGESDLVYAYALPLKNFKK